MSAIRLVQEIADGKWNGAISAPALREAARAALAPCDLCAGTFAEHEPDCPALVPVGHPTC